MKHTKGEWVKGSNTAKRDWMQIFCNGKLIAEAKELSKKWNRKATDFEEEGANAALIAAAPDLLEALQVIKNVLTGWDHKDGKYANLIFHAESAIKKATI